MESIAESNQEDIGTNDDPSTSVKYDSFQSSRTSSSMGMQRFPSMNNLSNNGPMPNGSDCSSPHSRRTASWGGGNFGDSCTSPKIGEIKPLGEALGMPPSSFMPDESLMRSPMNNGSTAEDLHEVEL